MYVYIYVCIYMYIYYIYIPKATSAPPRAGTTGNLIQLTCKLIKLKTCLVLTFTALIFFIFSSFSIEKKPDKSKPHLSGHHSGLEEKTPPDRRKGAEGRPEEEDREKKKQQGRKQVRKTLAAESSWRHGFVGQGVKHFSSSKLSFIFYELSREV